MASAAPSFQRKDGGNMRIIRSSIASDEGGGGFCGGPLRHCKREIGVDMAQVFEFEYTVKAENPVQEGGKRVVGWVFDNKAEMMDKLGQLIDEHTLCQFTVCKSVNLEATMRRGFDSSEEEA